ncbi:MAG: class I SAM-dependent methyltransferase [Bacillota bacterium]|nr:class I SAM-dependent methyltransferase [Bacillota bacterium]
MNFYVELSNYYDVIFPPQPAQLKLLTEEFEQAGAGGKILDVACANGGYSVELAKRGFDVTGFDLVDKMISLAKAKKEKLTDNQLKDKISFFTGDMRYADKYGHDFQGAFCIGNSIVHLTDSADIYQAISSFYKALKPNGVAIVQIVNFDRIVKYKVDSLATIDEEKASLERNYIHLENGLIDFQTVLTVKESGNNKVYRNSVHLKPLLKNELKQMFIEAGFSNITFYGGYNKIPHDENSPATVAVARK